MFVCGVEQSLIQLYAIMKKYLSLIVLSLAFFPGCESSNRSRFLYPSDKAMSVRYLCSLPYLYPNAPHQSWSKSKPDWLIINESKVIVFFENDRTFVLPRTLKDTLPPGKYRCIL